MPALEPDWTPETRALFVELANDADNWSGEPLYDRRDAASRGNLTDLKKRGLVTTFAEGDLVWVRFTGAGRTLARDLDCDTGYWTQAS